MPLRVVIARFSKRAKRRKPFGSNAPESLRHMRARKSRRGKVLSARNFNILCIMRVIIIDGKCVTEGGGQRRLSSRMALYSNRLHPTYLCPIRIRLSAAPVCGVVLLFYWGLGHM